MKQIVFFWVLSLLTSTSLYAQHLFLLAGQSNANGQGDSKKSNLFVNKLGFEYDVLLDSIKPLKDPIGQKWHLLEPANSGTIMPAFIETFTNFTKLPVIVVTSSKGGSSCSKKAELSNYSTWDENGVLFKDAIEKTDKAILKAGQKLNGVIWMQGERDANAINDSLLTPKEYQFALISLIQRFRNKYGSKLPFFIVQTGYQSARPKLGNDAIRKMQAKVARKLKHVYIAYSETNIFFEKKWMKDNVHYNQEGLNDIGIKVGKFIANYYKFS